MRRVKTYDISYLVILTNVVLSTPRENAIQYMRVCKQRSSSELTLRVQRLREIPTFRGRWEIRFNSTVAVNNVH